MVPAILLVLACCLGGLQLAGQQLRLQDAAAASARSIARGGSAPVIDGVRVVTRVDGQLLCARVVAASVVPLLPMQLSAESCALDGGL